MEKAPTLRSTRARRIARAAAPWVVTIAAVVAILSRFSYDEIAKRVRDGNALAMVPVAIVFTILHLLSVVTWDWFVFRTLVPGLRWSRLARVKAGIATMQSIAFAATQAAYVAWIARGAKFGVRNGIGLVGVLGLCDLTGGSIVITGAVFFGHADVLLVFKIAAPILAVVVPSALLLPARRPLDPTRESGIFRVATAVPRRAILQSICGRMTTATMMAVTTWAAARAFGMSVPFR